MRERRPRPARPRKSRAGRTRRIRERKTPEGSYSRSELFARWHGACCYCGAPAEHVDHIKPLSRGGRDVLANVVPACADCNLSKSAQTLAQWAGTF